MNNPEPVEPPLVDPAFHGHLRPGAVPAILVVDMVNAYLDPESPLYAAAEQTLGPAGRLLDAARTLGVPVLYTRVRYASGGVDGGVFFAKVPALAEFVGDSVPGAIVEPLAPHPGDVVVIKQYASAFFATSLASTLRALGCDTTVILGYSTSGCVRATAVDACQHGFVPLVVRECTADKTARSHEAALYDIQAKYGEVISTAAAVAYLQDPNRRLGAS
jgi:maleamate amidohydrolase